MSPFLSASETPPCVPSSFASSSTERGEHLTTLEGRVTNSAVCPGLRGSLGRGLSVVKGGKSRALWEVDFLEGRFSIVRLAESLQLEETLIPNHPRVNTLRKNQGPLGPPPLCTRGWTQKS